MLLKGARHAFACLIVASLMAMPAFADDHGGIVKYGDVVEPDAELLAFIEQLRADIGRGPAGVDAVEAKFAQRLQAFSRSLDPLQPWFKLKPIRKDHLKQVADLIVEQGDMVDANGNSVAAQTDYRPQALEMIGLMLKPGRPLGTMAEMPGAICAPAAYKFDQAAAAAFAKQHDTSGASLQFFTRDIELLTKARKGAKVMAVVPAGTLMAWAFEKDLPKDWNRYFAANGADGYMQNREDYLNLSQMHVCFSKVKGQYRISAMFGYGL